MSFWKKLGIPSILIALLFLSGCASFNRYEASDQGGWKTIEDADKSLDAVKVGMTVAELEALHLGPRSPNVLRTGFIGAKKLAGIKDWEPDKILLPKLLEECLIARERCGALVVRGKKTHTDGQEDIASRLLFDKEDSETSGWEISAIIFLLDDKVVYVERNEVGNIQEHKEKFDPLALPKKMTDTVAEEAAKLKLGDIHTAVGGF